MHASLRAANIQAQFSFVIALARGALRSSAVIWLGVWLVDQPVDHRRHAGAVRPAAAEHVQAGPQDRQRVVQGRQGLRQRRAHRRPARPGGRRHRPPRTPCPAPPLEGRLAFQHVASPTRPSTRTGQRVASRATGAARHRLRGGTPGEVVALVGYERRGQEHDRPAGATAVRPRQGTGAGRRARRARRHPRLAAAAGQPGAAGDRAAERHRRREHRLRDRRRHPRGHRDGRPDGQRPRLHHGAARRVRDHPRRARLHAVRRTASAPGHRPGLHPTGTHPDPRRADHRPRPGVGPGRRQRPAGA